MRWKSIVAMCAAGVAALVGVACGDGGGGESEPSDTPPPTPAAAKASQPDPIEPGLLTTLLADTSDFQRDLLEDGMLTLDEYERAKLEQARCLMDQGLEIDPDRLQLDGLLRYTYFITASAEIAPEAPAIMRDCQATYSIEVDRAWAEVSLPLLDNVIAESKAMVYGCLVDSGFDPGDSNVDPESPEFLAAEEDCATTMRETLDMIAYWGFE